VFVLCVAAISSVAAQDGAAEAPAPILSRPALVYKTEDRASILKRIAPGKDSFTPGGEDKASSDPVKSLLATYRFEYNAEKDLVKGNEERRSDLFFKLALLTWLDPAGEYPSKKTYIDAVRTAVAAIAEADVGRGENIIDKGGDPKKPGQWDTYLKSAVSLWDYALAYDLLSTPQVRAAGLTEEDLNKLYVRLADGIVRLLVHHLRSYEEPGRGWKDPKTPPGNNWNSREFSGVGMALLALRDRFAGEPASSQRSTDFKDGLRLVKDLFGEYLDGWGGPKRGDGPMCFYYEGPHYLRYWVEYGLGFGVAWRRAFPKDSFDILRTGGAVSRFCLAHTIWCVASGHKNNAPEWSCAPVDDSWTYPDEYYVPVLLAAAWIDYPAPEHAMMVASVKHTEGHAHPLLLAHPILDELNDGKPPAPLPLTAGIAHDGVGVARSSGENEKALSVFVKNFETPIDSKDGSPSLFSHSHSDNGQVLAYRDAEPVLIDPAYGPKGYANKSISNVFTHWEHRNTLCVEEEADSGKFVLPVWKDYGPHERLTRAETVTDALGEFRVLEMTTPAHRRTVIVPNDSCILVIDRLEQPKRVKLCWWGNGSITGRENEGAKSGKPWEGEAEKIATAAIDTEKAEAVYFRGPALAEKIHVILPGGQTITTPDGEYGPKWYNTNYPLSGMHAVSKAPVQYAVTLVEIAPKAGHAAPRFKLSAQTTEDAGKLAAVRVTDGGTSVEYLLSADGKIERATIKN
jgi:hypothetical protein